MQTEEIKISTEYIKLDQLLKFSGIAEKYVYESGNGSVNALSLCKKPEKLPFIHIAQVIFARKVKVAIKIPLSTNL